MPKPPICINNSDPTPVCPTQSTDYINLKDGNNVKIFDNKK